MGHNVPKLGHILVQCDLIIDVLLAVAHCGSKWHVPSPYWHILIQGDIMWRSHVILDHYVLSTMAHVNPMWQNVPSVWHIMSSFDIMCCLLCHIMSSFDIMCRLLCHIMSSFDIMCRLPYHNVPAVYIYNVLFIKCHFGITFMNTASQLWGGSYSLKVRHNCTLYLVDFFNAIMILYHFQFVFGFSFLFSHIPDIVFQFKMNIVLFFQFSDELDVFISLKQSQYDAKE